MLEMKMNTCEITHNFMLLVKVKYNINHWQKEKGRKDKQDTTQKTKD
jgi:hypothetical protein